MHQHLSTHNLKIYGKCNIYYIWQVALSVNIIYFSNPNCKESLVRSNMNNVEASLQHCVSTQAIFCCAPVLSVLPDYSLFRHWGKEHITCIIDTHNWSSSWHWQISPTTTVIEPPCSMLMHYVPPNFTHSVAGSCWILKLFSSRKCTRHFWKFLHSKHTIFSCILPCHVSNHMYLFKLFSCFKV